MSIPGAPCRSSLGSSCSPSWSSPLLLLDLELIIVGSVLAASLLGRVVLGRHWLVEARAVSGFAAERVLEWKIAGWRRSRTHIQQIVSELAASNAPGLARPVVSCGYIGAINHDR
jgi:hypothetical protein